MNTVVKDLLKKMKTCDSKHNRCDYLLDHSEIDYLLEYIEELQLENKDLKLRSRPMIGPYHADGYITQEMEYQERKGLEKAQKEFIKYLEDKVKACELTCDLIFNHNKEMKIYKKGFIKI